MTNLVGDARSDTDQSADRRSRVLTFVVVLWGEKFRRLFVEYCLASLLAPENLPFIATVDACGIRAKFIICSTRADYAALAQEPLFSQLQRYAEVSLIDIGYPETSTMLHMSKGHKAALKRCVAEKSYCSVLAPDIILANGSVRKLVEIVNRNVRVALFPAFRFDLDEVRQRLVAGSYLAPGAPLAIEPRRLAAIAAESLHPEVQQFEFDRSCFSGNPHSTIFRRPGNGWLFHTVSWGIACVDFSCLESISDQHFDVDTIDAHFVNDHIFGRPEFGEPVTLNDSDDFLMVPLTTEEDMPERLLLSDNPLYADRPPEQIEDIKIGFIRSLLFSPACDDFKRWAYRIPVNIHPAPLPADTDATTQRATAIVTRALQIEPLPAPLYLMATVCDADQLDQLFAVLLPSLLAPGNAPVLAGVPGCRLLIATSASWRAGISCHRLFERIGNLIAVEFIELAPAELGDASAGIACALERCVARCVADRAFGSFLWPDLLLGDGALRRVLEVIKDGYEAAVVPVPHFRFQRRKRKNEKLGGMEEIVLSGRRPIVLSGRQLASAILDCLDSDEPLEPANTPSLPRNLAVKTASGFVFHDTDWAVLFCDFRQLAPSEAGQMAALHGALSRMQERGKLYLVTDSDDLAVLSVVHGVGRGIAPLGAGALAQRGAPDPLSRALYLQPAWFHADDLPQDHETVAAETVRAATAALENRTSDASSRTRASRQRSRYFYQWRIPWARRAKPDLVRTLKDTTPALRWLVLLSAGAWHYRGPIWRRVTAVLRGDRESIRWLLAHLQRAGTMMRAVDQSARASAAHKKAPRKS